LNAAAAVDFISKEMRKVVNDAERAMLLQAEQQQSEPVVGASSSHNSIWKHHHQIISEQVRN